MDRSAKLFLVGLVVAILVGGALIERELGKGHGRRHDKTPRVGMLLGPLTTDGLPNVPAGAPGAEGGGATRPASVYVVEEGDTLGKIAKKTLGSTQAWPALLEANRDTLDRPERLRTGMRLRVPAQRATAGRSNARASAPAASSASSAPASAPRPAAPTGTPGTVGPDGMYTVQSGDTLGAIAQRTLGSIRDAPRLLEANRDVLASPDRLQVGMRLKIPH